MASRIYLVRQKGAPEGTPRLVRATHPANALRHVADGAYSVSVATQDELEQLLTAGQRVEKINHEQQELPQP